MKPVFAIAAGIAIGASLAATAAFADTATISAVDVDAMLDDVDANALDYWPSIEEDLADAILAEARDNRSDDGYEIAVELREVSLSGSSLLTGGGEFNHLSGWIYFRAPGNPVPVWQEAVIVDAQTGVVSPGPGTVVAPDKPEFYAALLRGFSKGTMDQLALLDPVGSEPAENRREAN